MNAIVDVVDQFTALLWGWPLLILIVGGGLLISIRTHFFQVRHAGFIMKQTIGSIFKKANNGEGTVSAFQAMTTALASSIGAANIVVAPTIIFTAGPGAIFWMWVAAMIGQSTKFAEVALSIKYREKNEVGEYVGGASYTLKNGLKGTFGKVMGALVAFFFMIEILPSITLQTLSAVGPMVNVGSEFGFDPHIVKYVAIGLIFILTALVVYGGVKSIGRTTEKLVPFMALLYIVFGLIVIVRYIQDVPEAFRYIFVGAFNPKAIAGGFAGATLRNVIEAGVARGVYSSEAGMGSAGYGHAAATTDHPARQGLWGCFEVIADTVVLTISTLVVVLGEVWKPTMTPKELTATAPVAVERAFNTIFGTFGSIILSISLVLFVLSTIIVIVFYCEKQAEYLWGTHVGYVFRVIATLMIIMGAFVSFDNAGSFLDLTLGLVVIPNMIGLILMSGEVAEMERDFFGQEKYYPGIPEKKK
ncbi:MAG: amino acid carrier protein [Aerococcus sp.]|nr:amino acid carrier protein [Aerococcus sp.]